MLAFWLEGRYWEDYSYMLLDGLYTRMDMRTWIDLMLYMERHLYIETQQGNDMDIIPPMEVQRSLDNSINGIIRYYDSDEETIRAPSTNLDSD